jgi:hypothetical protein
LQALAQLSEIMIILADEGELEHARAVHEAIGKLLIPSNEPWDAGRASVVPLKNAERARKEA